MEEIVALNERKLELILVTCWLPAAIESVAPGKRNYRPRHAIWDNGAFKYRRHGSEKNISKKPSWALFCALLTLKLSFVAHIFVFLNFLLFFFSVNPTDTLIRSFW